LTIYEVCNQLSLRLQDKYPKWNFYFVFKDGYIKGLIFIEGEILELVTSKYHDDTVFQDIDIDYLFNKIVRTYDERVIEASS
jgi:hypothetical protein